MRSRSIRKTARGQRIPPKLHRKPPEKPKPSLFRLSLKRFDGLNGRRFPLEALQIQPILVGDVVLAKSIAEACEVASFDPGGSFIEESASDNDLYFIL